MKLLFLLITFIINFDYIFLSGCPLGSRPGLTSNICYQLYAETTTWFDAEYICGSNGGHLASVSSAFVNTFLSEMADGYFNESSDFWLGGFNSFVVGTWAWSDYGNFSYTNWASGQPSNSNTTSCISSQFPSSNWYASDCLQRKPFICELFLSHEPCPKDWLYWSYTNKCYSYSYQGGLTFYDASAFCQNLSATLTSVHNGAENFFIAAQGLAYYNDNYNFGESWLGLHDPNQNGQWQWTDGTIVNFTYWGSNYPDGKAFCAALVNGDGYDAQGLENRWATFSCNDGLAFWCSMDSLI